MATKPIPMVAANGSTTRYWLGSDIERAAAKAGTVVFGADGQWWQVVEIARARTNSITVEYTGWGKVVSAAYAAKAQEVERLKTELDYVRSCAKPMFDAPLNETHAAAAAKAQEIEAQLRRMDKRVVARVMPQVEVN